MSQSAESCGGCLKVKHLTARSHMLVFNPPLGEAVLEVCCCKFLVQNEKPQRNAAWYRGSDCLAS